MPRFGFQPTLDQDTTNQLLEQYKQQPDSLDYQQTSLLRDHAEHYQVESPDTQLAENGFASMMSQAGKGWIAGFTTLNIDHGEVDKQPRTSWERIARSLGHLGGFVGYVPGLRVLSKLGVASKLATNLLKIRGQSIPLMAGKAVTGGIKKTAIGLGKRGVNKKGEAVNSVAKFMNTVPGDMVEGAMNLGIASGVSAWQEGIHAVADATLGGGIAGAGFRAIGNLIKVPGAKPVIPGTPLKELTKSQVNEKVLKGVAGSLMMGLPATLRGATTEEQIYDYLLGAFFGQGETHIQSRRAIEHLHKMKTQYKDPETGVTGTASPELVEGWETMDPKTKDLVKEITTKDIEQGGVISAILSRDYAMKLKEMQEAEKKAKEIYEGEPVERVRKPEEELTESRDGKGNDGETSPELIDNTQAYEALFTKAKHYVQRHLENEWIEAPDKQIAMEDTWRLINRKWNQVVGENLSAGSPENPGLNMIKWVNKRFKKQIVESPTDPEWSFWIKWGNSRVHNKPVQVASIHIDMEPAYSRARRTKDEDTDIDFNPDIRLNILNPNLEPDAVNLAGNAKQLREPVKNIESAYQREYFERHGVEIDAKTEPVYAVVDNITSNARSKGRYPEELTFSDWRRDLIKQAETKAETLDKEFDHWEGFKSKAKREAMDKWMEAEVEKNYNNAMATITKQMAEKGYMYLGGKGDAERLYFVKEHPLFAAKMNFKGGTTRRRPNAIIKEFQKILEVADPEVKKDYRREKELFQEAFAKHSGMSKFLKENTLTKEQAGRLFDRSYLNNIMYDLSMNGLPFTREGFQKLNDSGMINTAKNFNKRSQIWFTNGIPAEHKFVKEWIKDNVGYDIPDEGFRYILTKDTKGDTHTGSWASEYVHTMDGEILTLPEIVDSFNASQGLPYGAKSGYVNKSFIVSPDTKFGALLGKYQFKAVPEEQAVAMRRANIDMIIPESSAKQYGGRDMWDSWDWTGRGIRLNGQGLNARKRYNLPVGDVKIVPSEVTSDKFIKPQRLPKQMQSNLTPFGFGKIKQEVIDSIFERASIESFNGTKDFNELGEKLLKNPGDTASETKLLGNLEDLGIPKLLDLINSPNHEGFATKAYNKILKINEQIVSELQAEGEMSSQDAHSLKLDAMEWQSVFDRIIQLKPDSLVPLLHKVGDSYRQSVMRNYILAQIVKPRMKNSATSRMTGYDKYLESKLPELNSRDDIFYLDEGYRDLKIIMDDGKTLTLGEIWEQSQKPRLNADVKKRFEDVMEAVAVRVPMDSLSGAHKLQFKGFTGRKGFGSVLHPRTMEALGGADLDGDKASFFFGGEKYGFKKAWRDAYGRQKEEYYTKDDGIKLSPLKKIISGAQTGADVGGLEGGLKLKLDTGGIMPLAYQDEKGTQPGHAKKYGVTEYISEAEGKKALAQPKEKFTADFITIPKGAGRKVKRVMTPARKKKALEGNKREQVNWIKEELEEFYKEARGKDLEKLQDEALDVLRAGFRFKSKTGLGRDPIQKAMGKHLNNILRSLVDNDGNIIGEGVFESHKKKIIDRVGEKEFNKVEGWEYDKVVQWVQSEAKGFKPKKQPKEMLDVLPSHLSPTEKQWVQKHMPYWKGKVGEFQKLYLPRTMLNVNRSDGTVLYYRGNIKGGTSRTRDIAEELGKPVIENPSPKALNEWLIENNIETLNVAGSRGSKNKGLEKEVTDNIVEANTPKQGTDLVTVDSNKPKDMRELLTSQDHELLKRIKTPSLRWSPHLRYQASTGAHVGRGMLGPSVVNRSSILAAYNQVRSMLDYEGENTFIKRDMWGNPVFELTPVRTKEGLKKFRRIARATVAFASDPMDEAGLKGVDTFFNSIFDSLFRMKVHYKNKKTGHKWTVSNEGLSTKDRKKAFVGIMSGINSASFGRNLETGKAHNVFDFVQSVKRVEKLPAVGGKGGRTDISFNGKIANLTKNIDFSDSLLHRMDRHKLDAWYENLKETLSSNDYQELRVLLGRGSMSIPKNRPLEIVQKFNLFNIDSRAEFIWDEGFSALLYSHPNYFLNEYKRLHDNPDIFSTLPEKGARIDKWMKKEGETGSRYGVHEKMKVGNRIQWTLNGKPHNKITESDIIALAGGVDGLNINSRKKVLENIIKLAGDSLSNDMGDWASARLLREVWNREAVPPEKFQEMVKIVDAIQKLKSKQDKERDALEPLKDLDMDEKTKNMILEIDRGIEGETTTREMDQRQIDNVIAETKNGMSRHESDLFDAMLISSWKTGDPKLVERLQVAKDKIDKSKKSYGWKSYQALQRYLDTKSRSLHNTKFNRVGFASKEVADHIIKRQLDLMEQAYEQFRYEDSARDTRVADQITKNLEAENKKQPLFDEAGNRTEGLAIQSNDYSTKTKKYLNEYAPFAGLEKSLDVRASSKSKKIMNELISNMDYYGPKTRENLHLIVRDMINKDINTMTLEDWQIVNNIFKEHRDGTWFQKTFHKAKGEFPELAKRFYHMFPEAVDRNIMKHEIKWNDVDTIYKDRHGNWITGRGKSAQGWMGELQRNIHLSQELSTMENQREEREWGELTEPYTTTELGTGLWDLAVAKFESDYMPRKLRDQGVTGDKLTEEYARNYERKTAKLMEELDWENTQGRLLTLTSGVRKSAGELVKEIHQILALKNSDNHNRLIGDPEVWKQFVETKKTGSDGPKELEYYTTVDGKTGEIVPTSIPVVSRKKMIKWVTDHFVNNKPFPIQELGMDGQRKIILGMQMGQIREAERLAGDKAPIKQVLLGGLSERLSSKRVDFDTGMLGEVKTVGDKAGIYGYFPHVAKHFEKGIMTGDLTKKIKIIWESNRPQEEKKQMIAKLYMKSKQLSGDFVEADIINETWEHISDAIIKQQQGRKPVSEVKWFDNLSRIGNQFSRENHVDGWSTSPEAYLDYTQSITKTFYRNLGQILSRETINEFAKTHKDMPTDLRTSWMNYFKLYAQQSLGFPAIIPNEMFENDKMKIKGTLYGALADNRVATRFDQIGRKLGLVGKGKGLPEELKSLDKLSAQTVINLGNAEAKYALATLLAHPKSSVGNYLGGSQMTIVNAGLGNFVKAKQLDYLRKTIDPKFKSWDDVNKWVRELGIIEEFIIREIGANPRLTGANWKAFLKDFRRAIHKDPELPDFNMQDLMKKHKIGKGMMDIAGKFMSLPERALRRDSFIAHYIQARDKLGGRTLPKDHPYLIEMGKKGVKATQFLYSVPFRPMFAGTAMGKVVSRFQLWAWNSVRYRNTIIREAATRGISEGSQEFERFKRLMIADTLSIALGSMFMYSLFGSQMPQPYAWFQDLGDWLFGNDEARDRAFFGAYPAQLAPLQLITPPSARLTGPILNGLINGDWEKMANYYIWTMFPFGRLARDLVGPGGLTENPYYGIDKLTGIPVVGTKRLASKRTKAEEKGEEFWTPPGLKVSNYFEGGDE